MNHISPKLWNVISRISAAIIGGYSCCIAASFALIPILHIFFGMPLPDSVYLATILSYLFYVAFIVWSFCPKTALLAWRNILLFHVCCGTIYLVLLPQQGVTP